MAKVDKIENKEVVVEKKLIKKPEKAHIQKKENLKKIFLTVLLMCNQLLTIQ